MVGPDGDLAALEGLTALGGIIDRSDLRLTTDSDAAHIASVRAALGGGVMQGGIAARDPLLEPVLPSCVSWSIDAWLVLHDDLRRLPVVRLVTNYLSAVLPTVFRTVFRTGRLLPHADTTTPPARS